MRGLVLIPAYNEADRIAGVVAGARQAAPEFDIIVVDDGSQDATAATAGAAGALVVSHLFNMGYGVTIQTGYKYAWAKGYDLLVQIDGDGQHDMTGWRLSRMSSAPVCPPQPSSSAPSSSSCSSTCNFPSKYPGSATR